MTFNIKVHRFSFHKQELISEQDSKYKKNLGRLLLSVSDSCRSSEDTLCIQIDMLTKCLENTDDFMKTVKMRTICGIQHF